MRLAERAAGFGAAAADRGGASRQGGDADQRRHAMVALFGLRRSLAGHGDQRQPARRAGQRRRTSSRARPSGVAGDPHARVRADRRGDRRARRGVVIPNITRGGADGRAARLPRRAGPARTSTPSRTWWPATRRCMAWHDDAELDRAAAIEIARDARPSAARVRHARDDAGQATSDGRRSGERDAHVWHCSLNLGAEEGALADEQMGADRRGVHRADGVRAASTRAGGSPSATARRRAATITCTWSSRWCTRTARKANVWNDRPRAQAACGELERQHGLTRARVARRRARRGARAQARRARSSPPRAGQRGAGARAARAGRARLRGGRASTRPSSCAACAAPACGCGRATPPAATTSWPATRPRCAPPAGQAPVWYGGGHLARDLTLPRLRAQWPDTPAGGAAPRSPNGTRRGATGASPRPGASSTSPTRSCGQRYGDELAALREQLRTRPRRRRRDVGARRARDRRARSPRGRCASSRRPARSPRPPAQLARSAQLHAHQVRPSRAPACRAAAGVALLLASAARGGRGAVGEAALLRQLANTAQALHDAHVAAGRGAQRAGARRRRARAARQRRAASSHPSTRPRRRPGPASAARRPARRCPARCRRARRRRAARGRRDTTRRRRRAEAKSNDDATLRHGRS